MKRPEDIQQLLRYHHVPYNSSCVVLLCEVLTYTNLSRQASAAQILRIRKRAATINASVNAHNTHLNIEYVFMEVQQCICTLIANYLSLVQL